MATKQTAATSEEVLRRGKGASESEEMARQDAEELEEIRRRRKEAKEKLQKAQPAQPAPGAGNDLEAEETEEEKARKAAEAEADKLRETARKALKKTAEEINARLERAEKAAEKSDDLRLSAAVYLKEAKEVCDANTIDFKAWCGENIKQSWERNRKLLSVAMSPDPKEALAQMRLANAQANKALRERKKLEAQKREAPVEAAVTSAPGRASPLKREAEGPQAPRKEPVNVAEEALARLPDNVQLTLAEGIAYRTGMRIVPEKKAKTLTDLERDPVGAMRGFFEQMLAQHKMEFVRWAAEYVGAKLETSI